ncbi:MAG: phosphoenolpyruvate mutase [Planctomycetia bacterium]|nr:phosphoenolpyruvate mutase [Planctomycetia bacterium]
MKKKTTFLRELITSPDLTFLMEAHHGLSAKIVEETGFSGIWASGLSISAQLGVRDNNEASWTQVLDVLEFMSDATTIPILLDGDTGYGNFNNMRRLVHKLEQREIGGVCIEDKLFPKTNSFIDGEAQPLASVEEFCGKIKAAKDSQKDADFVVVARTEAFIAGWGLSEAIRRAEAYRKAGADAILVHSKKSNDSDIVAFMNEWGNRHPVVIVPTKYFSVPTEKFERMGISTVIWANHNIRSSIQAMQVTCQKIFQDRSLVHVEDKIVSVAEVFRIQGAEELKEAEKRYLPKNVANTNAIILAATQGKFGELTREIPKTMLEIGGRSILGRQIDTMNAEGIRDITVVRGFAPDKIPFTNVQYRLNEDFAQTRELSSLYLALDKISHSTILTYGDIIFKPYVLHELLQDENEITIVVDADFTPRDPHQDFIVTDKTYQQNLFTEDAKMLKISNEINGATGEFIGLIKVHGQGATLLKSTMEELARQENFSKMTLHHLFQELLKKTEIAVKFIKGSWMDVDTLVDLQNAKEL